MLVVEPEQGLLSWSRPCGYPPFLIPPTTHKPMSFRICATVNSVNESIEGHHNLTAKERRQLRNSRRESKAGTYNWREEVEQRLIKKPKKRGSWTDELNLDKLALLGSQWWVVRVSRVAVADTSERLARLLAQKFPYLDFKVLFIGCVFPSHEFCAMTIDYSSCAKLIVSMLWSVSSSFIVRPEFFCVCNDSVPCTQVYRNFLISRIQDQKTRPLITRSLFLSTSMQLHL